MSFQTIDTRPSLIHPNSDAAFLITALEPQGAVCSRDIDPNNVSQLCPSDTSSAVPGLPLDWPQWVHTLKCQPCQGPHSVASSVLSRLTSVLELQGARAHIITAPFSSIVTPPAPNQIPLLPHLLLSAVVAKEEANPLSRWKKLHYSESPLWCTNHKHSLFSLGVIGLLGH